MMTFLWILSFSICNVLLIVTAKYENVDKKIKSLEQKCQRFKPEIESRNITIYEPTWDSLDKRPVPLWYTGAKVGIMVSWGVYSVPSFLNESFWYYWKKQKDPQLENFMRINYKPGFTYTDFAALFTAEFLNTDKMAMLLQSAGAEYVVINAKSPEGFSMWPSNYSFNWNSIDVGPKTDIVGKMVESIRKQFMRIGLYYSLSEWFHPVFLRDQANNYKTQHYVSMKAMPELHDLVNRYKPDILWSDNTGNAPSSYWNATHLMAWLYNSSPVKEEVVVNDRWGNDTPCKHGGFFTCFEPNANAKKWESTLSIDKKSKGYRRDAELNDFVTTEELITTLVETISRGGNLLINVAPAADGTIQPVYQERLVQMGSWLKTNFEAIYGSFSWKYQNDTVTPSIWYTEQEIKTTKAVYAITLEWPRKYLFLGAPSPNNNTFVYLLGTEFQLNWTKPSQGGINITVPNIPYSRLPCKWAWVFRLLGLDNT